MLEIMHLSYCQRTVEAMELEENQESLIPYLTL